MTPKDKILFALRMGEERAVSTKDLRQISGLDERHLRKAIEFLRREGYVICSSGKGYYYPAVKSELERFVHKENRRINTQRATLKAAQRRLNEWGGEL